MLRRVKLVRTLLRLLRTCGINGQSWGGLHGGKFVTFENPVTDGDIQAGFRLKTQLAVTESPGQRSSAATGHAVSFLFRFHVAQAPQLGTVNFQWPLILAWAGKVDDVQNRIAKGENRFIRFCPIELCGLRETEPHGACTTKKSNSAARQDLL